MESNESRQLFQSSTMIGKQQCKKLLQLLQNLIDSSDSIQFRNPVDWQGLGLTDYLIVVKKPMDLNTVKKNLNSNYYHSVESCLMDIQLIWDNCKLYNNKQNWIYKLADKLQKMFKKMIKNYLPFVTLDGALKRANKQPVVKKSVQKVPQAEPKDYNQLRSQQEQVQIVPQEDPALTKRKQLLYFLPLCPPQKMGIVFLLIYKNNPQAIVYSEDGIVNINVEHIDDTMINRLMDQLDMWGIGYATTIPNKKK